MAAMSNPTHSTTPLPALPKSWSELTWQQLTDCWTVKMRFGGNSDVARAAALLTLCGLTVRHDSGASFSRQTGEATSSLKGKDGRFFTVTARELAHLARHALTWFDFPYGDPGEKEERDEQGKVTKERREAVSGYVSGFRDAMELPIDKCTIYNAGFIIPGEKRKWWQRLSTLNSQLSTKVFSLPQVAMNNLTWQQYRSLQAIAPQLFQEGNTDGQVLHLQAQFLAHCLVPRSFALLDTSGGSIRLRPHWEFRYNAEQADGLARWWERRLSQSNQSNRDTQISTLFHICFQCYQTAIQYYSHVYPLLFQDSGKSDPLRDALTGEVGTINIVMKYAGYAEQQQVYDSNLPFVLDILNTMTKEAKEIEKMNSKIKKK